jgi:hypothetical protein
MAQDKSVTATYRDYNTLWNYNLQKIEQIQHLVDESIHDLEHSYAGFEDRYEEIMQQLDILSSIYAGYNIIQGSEYVLRLKSLLQTYRTRYTREGLDFNLIHSLLLKISEARDSSFDTFPEVSHEDMPFVVSGTRPVQDDYSGKKYKWVTFERNRSWFIAPFTTIDIMKNENYPVVSVEEPDYINFKINSHIVRVKDIFIKSLAEPETPSYFVMLDGKVKNFAAGQIGKRIYAGQNIIHPFIKPFKNIHDHPLSPGRVRLFGKNHILLN